VTLIGNHTSSHIEPLQKTSFLFLRMLILLKKSKKTYGQV